MGWLIAVLVAAMVLGPVLWMKPSAAQQRQTRLRLKARQLGLDVRLCNLPQTRRQRVRREDPVQGVVYRLPVPDRRKVVALEYLTVREAGGSPWEVEGQPAPGPGLQPVLQAVCAALPGDVIGLEVAPQGPACYWRERGDEDTVAQLAAELQRLREAMALPSAGAAADGP